jgi:hypothetical protein
MAKPVIELEDMTYTSRVWKKIAINLTSRLEYARQKLETCEEMIECAKYQAEIRLLKALINLPDTKQIVLDDSKKEKEKR